MSYDNTNRGSVWKNEHKTKDTHADFQGTINIDGVEYWLSAWKRKQGAKENAPVLSFHVKRKEVPQEVKEAVKPPTDSKFDNFDDDIPFIQPYHGGLWRVV